MSEPSPKAETLEDPWHKHKSLSNTEAIWQVLDSNGELVCSCSFEWDADDIIREHNAHAALVEACQDLETLAFMHANSLLINKDDLDAIQAKAAAALSKARQKGKE